VTPGATPKGTAGRREFLKASAAAATLLAARPLLHARGSDTVKVGLIGCGGRGTGAAYNSATSHPAVVIHALGDVFAERIESSRQSLACLDDRLQVTEDRCFVGIDAYQSVIASGVDLVILATPPHFRPRHLEAAIRAGVHVFMEKPAAVDAPGVRSVMRSAELARQSGLSIVAGTQRRHDIAYQQAMRRIHDGAIGNIVAARCTWNQGNLWIKPRQPDWSDMEWQLRNWIYFTWASGDHIVEQHIHNIDVMNWGLRAHPVAATALGGRQVRTDPAYGNVFDHFSVTFEYPGPVLVSSNCRQIDNCANEVSEWFVGTTGVSDGSTFVRRHSCPLPDWTFAGKRQNPFRLEHAALVRSIRRGEPINDGVRVAESTLSVIMGRMAAYTGQRVTWDMALDSKLDLTPPSYEFGDLPVQPVARPGITPFV